MKKKEILHTICFLAIGILLFIFVQSMFGISNQYAKHAEMMFDGYYEKEEDTLDAVLIGNSHVYRYWQSAFAWKEYGIAAMPLSTSDMPCTALKNMAIEACKTQSPKVIVFDAEVFADTDPEPSNKIYLLLENMKFSKNYFDTIDSFCSGYDMKWSDRMQYYFPIIQFHSRWTDLSKDDFTEKSPSYLNSCYLDKFLNDTIEYTEHSNTDERIPIGQVQERALRDLLEWCKEADVAIEFVAVPILHKEKKPAMVNYIGDIIEEAGFSFTNCNDPEFYESFGFVEDVDFQDINHTNVNGSYKFVKVFGKYLQEKYELPDHRGEDKYLSWDEEAEAYFDVIKDHLIY